MTNQASELYELCKEVYEKTWWGNQPSLCTNCNGDGYTAEHDPSAYDERGEHICDGCPIQEQCGQCQATGTSPLYTSDYLLEKLPRTVKDVMGEDAHLMLYPKGKVWNADYIGMFMEAKGETPLKALLKLTIALSEAGELDYE